MHGTMIMAEKNLKSETLNSCFPLTLPGWIAGEKSSMNWHASVYLPTTPATSDSCGLFCFCWFWCCCLLSVCKCWKTLSSKRYQFCTGTMLNEDNHTIMGALWLRCLHRIWICPFMRHVWVCMDMYGCMYGAIVCGYWVLYITFCTMEVGSSNLV